MHHRFQLRRLIRGFEDQTDQTLFLGVPWREPSRPSLFAAAARSPASVALSQGAVARNVNEGIGHASAEPEPEPGMRSKSQKKEQSLDLIGLFCELSKNYITITQVQHIQHGYGRLRLSVAQDN